MESAGSCRAPVDGALALAPSSSIAGDRDPSARGVADAEHLQRRRRQPHCRGLVRSDWVGVAVNKPPFSSVEDKINGTGDNAFGNGTSEDQEVPSLVTDSIPPNKSDITRFLQYNETIGTGGRQDVPLPRVGAHQRSVRQHELRLRAQQVQDAEQQRRHADPHRRRRADQVRPRQRRHNPVLGFHTWLTRQRQREHALRGELEVPCWGKVQPIGTTNFQASINAADRHRLDRSAAGRGRCRPGRSARPRSTSPARASCRRRRRASAPASRTPTSRAARRTPSTRR